MSDILRWPYGDTSPVVIPVESATVIEIGDLVYLDLGGRQARRLRWPTPAAKQPTKRPSTISSPAWPCSATRAGDTAPIRVATRGVFRVTLSVGRG